MLTFCHCSINTLGSVRAMFSNKQLSELMEMSDKILRWSDSLRQKMCLRFYCLIIIFVLHVLFLTCHCL